MKKVILKKYEERRLLSGHKWIFSNEIEKIDDAIINGEIVEIRDSKGQSLGIGFYNRSSLIAVRFLSNDKNISFEELAKTRISDAFTLRKELYPKRSSYRLIFSESDFLPGLIIDKYNDTYVLQINSAGIQLHIDSIIAILITDYKAKNIFTKNENFYRMLEGLPEEDKIYHGHTVPEIINDGNISFEINFSQSQKTGFYFDQSDNRFIVEKISKGKKVLDAFCNSGGFGLHAASAGAEKVVFVDSSAAELEKVNGNILLNNINTDTTTIQKDVFDFLEAEKAANHKYDVVIIDPPAFAKNKKTLKTASKGYERLNRLALSIINKGGFLVSSSCSYHIKKDDFIEIINSAAIKEGKEIQLVHFNGASLDHPSLPAMDETSYLKFAVFKVN